MNEFNLLHTHSTMIDENEFFEQFFNENLPERYDSNFFRLKYQPTIAEFELIEQMQLVYHLDAGLKHLKFYWPPNKGFTPEIVSYFEQEGYQIEMLELYSIEPAQFKAGKTDSEITIEPLSAQILKDFYQVNEPADRLHGQEFVNLKRRMYAAMVDDPAIVPYIAFIDGTAVGTVTAIVGDKTVEIDDLLTSENYRHQGVATALQKQVMQLAESQQKRVILVADGDDTPREMYLKQNYMFIGYQLGALKILPDQEEVFNE
ncbi:GNAT family N-acetyltransferase [Marinilactibacillus piezotolerans]|uniref:GNAT family N-acetyltransferase n=1 Tax=Marinilactibacillus piezotolerans TaxID=258723 RepID=UPI0009B10F7B|nr:GNAT family N-acetyltransferase [Marinilactibacillus piezotolerans]